MEPIFETACLRVFRIECMPDPVEFSLPRQVYLGFPSGPCGPETYPAVVLTVCEGNDLDGARYVDWVETMGLHRRLGLARELWWGVERHLGVRLVSGGVTRAGHGFLKSLGVEDDPLDAMYDDSDDGPDEEPGDGHGG